MSTKTLKSAGSQFTPKGPTQGNVLVDPKTGDPINTVNGKLDVNASVTATIGDIEIHADTSSVRIEDPSTGAHVRVELDGSINANVKVDSADGDNITVVGTEDGTVGGVKHAVRVTSNGTVKVQDDAAEASLASIDSKLPAGGLATSANQVTGNSSLASIDAKLTNQATAANQTAANTKLDTIHADLVVVEGKQDTGNASLASIDTKLSSQATALKQDTGNASLASIDTKLSSPLNVNVDAATGDNVAIGNTWTKIVDQPSPTTTYIGAASPGTLTSAANWQIKRITVSGSQTFIQYASGSVAFANIWNNRTSLSYS